MKTITYDETKWQLVPKLINEQMEEVANKIADGPWVTPQEHWTEMLTAAPVHFATVCGILKQEQ